MTARPHLQQLPRLIALLAVVAALLLAGNFASAQEASVRLSIKPVGDDHGSFFSVTANPGDTLRLEVELGNGGATPMEATTFAANTFTMPNGGFGIRDLDDEQTGTTRWVDYPTETLTIAPEQIVTRAFMLTVPTDTAPGDYVTSLVIQNANAIQGEGSVALNQIVRQAVAIAIDVPGERTPALAIDAVRHDASGARSVITFTVGNPGNTHLNPTGEFVLKDASGAEIDRRAGAMDRFYSQTQTTFAFALDDLLAPGDYFADLTLTDPGAGATAHVEGMPFNVPVVEVPATLNPDGSVAQEARTNAPVSSDDGPSLVVLGGIAAGCLVLGVALTVGVTRLRARSDTSPAPSPAPVVAPTATATAPVVASSARVKPLISRPPTDQGRAQPSIVQSTVGPTRNRTAP